MTDTTTVWSPGALYGDWALVGSKLQTDSDLETAVLISLFTDRIANPDDVIPDGSDDPRGWCSDDSAKPIGSRLWLLERVKLEKSIGRRARDYCIEALQWLIDDEVVIGFDISVEIVLPKQLRIFVVCNLRDGSKKPLKFPWVQAGTL